MMKYINRKEKDKATDLDILVQVGQKYICGALKQIPEWKIPRICTYFPHR